MHDRVLRGLLAGLVLMIGIFVAPINTAAQSTDLNENKALVQRYYDEIFNEVDLDLADEAIREILDQQFNFYHSGNPNPEVGWNGLRQFLHAERNGFPDAHFTVENIIAEGDLVAVRWTFEGTHTGVLFDIPASGNEVTLEGMDLFRVEDGKITELRRVLDVLSLAQQINAL